MYSVIPISMTLTSAMIIFTISINGALSKFLVSDYTKGSDEVSSTLNSAFYSLLILTILLVPIFYILIPKFADIIQIPESIHDEAIIMFRLIVLSFAFNTFTSLFNSVTFSKNLLDYRNFSLIILRFGVVIVLGFSYLLGYVGIFEYGIAILLSSISSLLYSYLIFKKIIPSFSFCIDDFDFQKLRNIVSMGGWLFLNQLGVLLFLQFVKQAS